MDVIKADLSVADGFFTTRTGGVSTAPFISLNLGLHVGDEEASVLHNRRLVEQYVGRSVVYMHQTHSCAVKKLEDFTAAPVDADGIITTCGDFCLAVMTADCLPLLLASADGAVVGAVHCGWRGIYGGIIHNAITLIRAETSAPIQAVMGPAIGPESFEVGEDLFSAFTCRDSEHALAFKPLGNGKYLCDIYTLCRQCLQKEEVMEISGGEHDTYTEEHLFFSYRREHDTGRMAGIIGRK
ncbi:MAG: peptidoglycan editing factor PgeF [Succinivibrio sp.]|nr:peptidoglycan editing factor PgeF [Succinivibrio sp.]